MHCLHFGLLWGAQSQWWFGDVYLKALPWGPVRQMNGFLLAYGSDLAHLAISHGQEEGSRLLNASSCLAHHSSSVTWANKVHRLWEMSIGGFLKIAVGSELVCYGEASRFSPPNSFYFLDFGPLGSPVEHLSWRTERNKSSREMHPSCFTASSLETPKGPSCLTLQSLVMCLEILLDWHMPGLLPWYPAGSLPLQQHISCSRRAIPPLQPARQRLFGSLCGSYCYVSEYVQV